MRISLSLLTVIGLSLAPACWSCRPNAEGSEDSALIGRWEARPHVESGEGDPITVCSDPQLTAATVSYATVVPSTASDLEVPDGALVVSPIDIVQVDEALFALDSQDPSVVRVERGRTPLRFGREGEGPGELISPRALAPGVGRNLYVGEERGRVTVFTEHGELIGTIPVRDRVRDLVVQPNGDVVVASLPAPGGAAYVRIVNSTGTVLRDVLFAGNGVGVHRPTLNARFNFVRLAPGPGGRFAVWYELDNYVQVFDSLGAPLGRIVGCVRAETAEWMEAAEARPSERYDRETYGLAFDDPESLVAVSLRYTEAGVAYLFRRYAISGDVVAERLVAVWDPRAAGPMSVAWDRDSPLLRPTEVSITHADEDLSHIEFLVYQNTEAGVHKVTIRPVENET